MNRGGAILKHKMHCYSKSCVTIIVRIGLNYVHMRDLSNEKCLLLALISTRSAAYMA